MTVAQWLDIWTAEYLGALKPRTVDNYKWHSGRFCVLFLLSKLVTNHSLCYYINVTLTRFFCKSVKLFFV